MRELVKKFQMLSVLAMGSVPDDLQPMVSEFNLGDGDQKQQLAETIKEIQSVLDTMSHHCSGAIPVDINKGLYGLMRAVYVHHQYILSDVNVGDVRACFELEAQHKESVFPTAVATLVFNTDSLLDKTMSKLSSDTEKSEAEREHLSHHVARLVSYLNLLYVYTTYTTNAAYDHHVIVEETKAEYATPLLAEIEENHDEALMLYEGAECLVMGREATTKGELYSEGVLTANSIMNVYGCEAWYDSVVNGFNKLIEKIQAGWNYFINLFKGDKSPQVTIDKAEEKAKETMLALTEKAKDNDIKPNDDAINKLIAAFESYELPDDSLKTSRTEIIAKLKALLQKGGTALLDGIKSIHVYAKAFYAKYVRQSSLLQKGKAKLDSVRARLSKLRGMKEEDKSAIAAERTELTGELKTAKELEAEARETVKSYERLGAPLIRLMYNPTNFVMM